MQPIGNLIVNRFNSNKQKVVADIFRAYNSYGRDNYHYLVNQIGPFPFYINVEDGTLFPILNACSDHIGAWIYELCLEIKRYGCYISGTIAYVSDEVTGIFEPTRKGWKWTFPVGMDEINVLDCFTNYIFQKIDINNDVGLDQDESLIQERKKMRTLATMFQNTCLL